MANTAVGYSIQYCSALQFTLFELFTPKRPLKPVRRERKKLKAQNLTITNVNVVVRVIRAFNIPLRDDVISNLHVTQQSTQLGSFEQDRLASENQEVGGVYTRGERPLEVGKVCTATFVSCSFQVMCYRIWALFHLTLKLVMETCSCGPLGHVGRIHSGMKS